MKFLKELVIRKHNEFFLQLKNNNFKPELFFEALSLANSFLDKLSEKQMRLRALLLRVYMWDVLKRSFIGVKFESLKEFNSTVISNHNIKSAPVINEIFDCMREDEPLLSLFYRKFKVDTKIEEKKLSYQDIKQKWSVGVVKGWQRRK